MNRNLTLLIAVVFLLGCKEKSISKINTLNTSADNLSIIIPNKTVNESDLFFDSKISIWTLDNELYSGYAESFYPNNTLKRKFGVLNGKKQNEDIQYFLDGHDKYVSNYHNGKLYGEKKSWSADSNHVLVSHLNYVNGMPHGEQKKYYPTGELFKKLNINMGKEEGIQQAFRKNGALYANYEAKEGRIYGLKKTQLCYQLDDEEVQY